MLRSGLVVLVFLQAYAAGIASTADLHLHGVVRDSLSRSPLAGATIRLVGSDRGAVAGADGVFHLHGLTGDTLRIDVHMTGYGRRILAVTGTSDDRRIEVLLQAETRTAQTVVVTADAIAGTPTQVVDQLTAAHVDEHRGQTFADVLRDVPGVTIVQTGPSVSKPMIHGMSGQRLVTLNAGIAQEGQQWGAEHAPEIDPFTPARIQVVKGPASVLYGPGAIGGVISVDPSPLPTTDRWVGEVAINGFLNNRQGAVGGYVANQGVLGLPVAWRVQASGRRAGDAATPDYRLTNTGFKEANGAADVGLHLGALDVQARASVFTTTLGIYRGSHLGNPSDLERVLARGGPARTDVFSYDIKRPRQEIRHDLLSVRLGYDLAEAGHLRLTYGWQQNSRAEYDAHSTRIVGRGDDPVERARDSVQRLERALATPAMELLLTTYSADLQWATAPADGWTATVGLSGQRQVNDRSGRVFLVPDYESFGSGGYGLVTMIAGRVTASAGLRYDARWLEARLQTRTGGAVVPDNRYFGSVTGSLGIRWAVDEAWSVAANVGTAWRPPHVNELYSNDVHHGVALYEVGNPGLRPERSVGTDVTVEWTAERWNLQATVYGNTFDGYIMSLPDPSQPTVTIRGTFPTYRFTQTTATIAGADVRLAAAVTDAVSVLATVSATRGHDAGRGAPLFLMPADRGRLAVHGHVPDVLGLHDAFVEVGVLGVRRQDQFEAGVDYVDPPPGYAAVDASVGGTVHTDALDIRLSFTVNNLTDQRFRDYLNRYRYVADDPGRNVTLRLTIPFGTE